jgi:hypothetical protein
MYIPYRRYNIYNSVHGFMRTQLLSVQLNYRYIRYGKGYFQPNIAVPSTILLDSTFTTRLKLKRSITQQPITTPSGQRNFPNACSHNQSTTLYHHLETSSFQKRGLSNFTTPCPPSKGFTYNTTDTTAPLFLHLLKLFITQFRAQL